MIFYLLIRLYCNVKTWIKHVVVVIEEIIYLTLLCIIYIIIFKIYGHGHGHGHGHGQTDKQFWHLVSMVGNVIEKNKIWNDEPEWRVIVCNLEYLIKT